MDTQNTKPLTQRIRECMDAGFQTEEGAKYVGMYDDGYRLVTNIINIASGHNAIDIKEQANKYLAKLDAQGNIGDLYQELFRFSVFNKLRKRQARRAAIKGLRLLRQTELKRISEFLGRTDLKPEDMSELKRINASITPDLRITQDDFRKIHRLIVAYSPFYHTQDRGNRVVGWRVVKDKMAEGLDALVDRPDLPLGVKKQALSFQAQMRDGRLPLTAWVQAAKLVADNKTNKEKSAKWANAAKGFEHALTMACQACDNLDGVEAPVLPRPVRLKLAIKLSDSAANLLRLQGSLLHGNNDDGEVL